MAVKIQNLKYWIQNTLPLVYDDSLSFSELLGKVVAKLNEVIDEVNDYFSEDIEVHIRAILQEWYESGKIEEIINQEIFGSFNDRLNLVERRVGRGINAEEFGTFTNDPVHNTKILQDAINHIATLTNTDKTLIIPSHIIQFTNLFIPKECNDMLIYSQGEKGAMLKCVDTTSQPAILSEAPNLEFNGFNMEGPSDYNFNKVSKVGIMAKRGIGELADIDYKIKDSRISRFHYGIEIWGRGLQVHDSLFSNCHYGVNLEWPSLSTYQEGTQVHQKDSTGFRGFVFVNNRYHSVGKGAIQNAGSNAQKINGILISGALMDIGRRLFTGVLKDSVITDFTITHTPEEAFELYDGSENYLISGGIISGDQNIEPYRVPDIFLKLRGNQKNFRISDIVFKNNMAHGIDIRFGAITNGVFEQLTFINPCINVTGYSPITFIGAGHKARIKGITIHSTNTFSGVVRTTSADCDINVEDVVTFGNDSRAFTGGGAHSTKKLHVDGADDRLELIGLGDPNGVHVAPVGSTYRRVDGGSGTCFYVKESGNGVATGWVPK